MGFKTTVHDCCIYRKIIDSEVIYLLCQMDDCLAVFYDQKTAKNLFNILWIKMRFISEEKKGIILLKNLGVVHDYNDFDIKQMSNYIDMSCENFIHHLCKYHGWENKKILLSSGNKKIRQILKLLLLLKYKC